MQWRITLLHSVQTRAATGQVTETFEQYAQPWAQRIEQRISERFTAGADQVDGSLIWRIHYRADVLQTDAVEYGDDRFEIMGIEEVGLREGLDLQCKRLGANV